MTTTHEVFIHQVRDRALKFAAAKLTQDERTSLENCKLVYGRGMIGLRGVTHFNAWKHTEHVDLVEICALGEESWVQLAGTTLHELGHVLAGMGSGHGKEWNAACAKLGLRRVFAAGTQYNLANFHPEIRMQLASLDKPTDGTPASWAALFGGSKPPKFRVCSAGIGTRGGTSRGKGSGSRLRKYICGCGQIIRASTDALQATCKKCNTDFTKA